MGEKRGEEKWERRAKKGGERGEIEGEERRGSVC